MPHRHTRRGFVRAAGAGVAGAVGAAFSGGVRVGAQAVDPQNADHVVVNAKVYTDQPNAQTAEAFAPKGGRVVAVGSADAVKALAGKGTETIDAKQMTIVPGFTDCHNHAPGNTLLYDVIVGNPFEVEFVTIRSIQDTLRARAKETPP